VGKVHLLSLGCPKNLVDSGHLLEKLRARGLGYSSDPNEADIIMVNTCGFIEDAKRESIGEILKLARIKEKEGKKLVVFGCLAKRYGKELKREIPEIDALWGVDETEEIVEYCSLNTRGGGKTGGDEEFTDTAYSYLKIAEGCDRNCSYCAIPKIRGACRSRKPEEVFSEAEALIRAGKKELILIAQDITSYGKDLKGYDLARLIRNISSLEGDFWIRLLYLYPSAIDDLLLETIAAEDKVCNYIDLPLQHSERKILKLMGRGGSRSYYEKLIKRIREVIPDVGIRTSIIVGFPQETEEDFEGMMKFIGKVRFDRLGAFKYSREEGTAAYDLKGQVPLRVKERRYKRVMELQSAISATVNEKLVGRTFRAIVDEVEKGVAVARIYSQAPDIDGVVFIEDPEVKKGMFVNVEIKEAYDYDLKGVVIK
jgi:ribosomal protein S12 methylthiotransferase